VGAIGLVVKVLKFPDNREACLQHLDIELGRDGLQIFRPQLEGEAIHDFPPGPETVGAGSGPFGQAQHQALVCMGMDVGNGRYGYPFDKAAILGTDSTGDHPWASMVITSGCQPSTVKAEAKRNLRCDMFGSILYIQPYTSEIPMLLTNLKIATMTGGYGLIETGAIRIDGDKIAWVGPAGEIASDQAIDCAGRLLTPGLIDCHTHLVYGGNRANEFEMRLNGASYADIAKAGGGIARPPATRAHRGRLHAITAAPGYFAGRGSRPSRSNPATGLISTQKSNAASRPALGPSAGRCGDIYLGAHHPARMDDRQAMALICDKRVAAIAQAGLADGRRFWSAFSVAEMAQVFDAAVQRPAVKLHAELSKSGRQTRRYKALSADHIEYLDEEVDAIADREVRCCCRGFLSPRETASARRSAALQRGSDCHCKRSQSRLFAGPFAARDDEHGLCPLRPDAGRGAHGGHGACCPGSRIEGSRHDRARHRGRSGAVDAGRPAILPIRGSIRWLR
jgi:hypothetical protein